MNLQPVLLFSLNQYLMKSMTAVPIPLPANFLLVASLPIRTAGNRLSL